MNNGLARTSPSVLLALMGGLLASAALALGSGQLAIVATEGVSMQPTYYEGDLVVMAKASSYSTGDIAAYRLANEYDVALHRIIGGDATGFVFQGDNNESVDPLQPRADDLVGRAVLHVPYAGTWLTILTSPPVLGVIAFALIAGGGTAAVSRNRRRNRRLTVSRHLSDLPYTPRQGTSLILSNLPAPLQAAAAGTAALGLLGATLGVLAWAGPLQESSTAEVKSGTNTVFSYTADVGESAAYDGTTATSPDPVFRKLANTADVDFAYHGDPGTISVVAELTSTSGWHSTVPLSSRQTFTGNTYEGSVSLDLESLEARADAAAAATGVAVSPLSIAVIPQVTTDSGAVFTPELKLSLTPLQLTLAGGKQALTVTDSSTSQVTVTTDRTLGFNGMTITAQAARTLSTVLLLATIVAAAVLLVMVRRAPARDEATAIRRRYASLLVRVHPMTAPSGRPLIDVTAFATLAKLAERYGLLVLHWNRSGVETFIVQDESTTYRYRPADNGSAAAEAEPSRPTAADGPVPSFTTIMVDRDQEPSGMGQL